MHNAVIYLDNNATTQVDREVLEVLLPFLTERWHNPSSHSRFSKCVKQAIEQSRQQIADLLSVQSQEVFFTSSGTESNNALLASMAHHAPVKKRRLLVSSIEHSSVLRTAAFLEEKYGIEVRHLPVESSGRLCLSALKEALAQGGVFGVSVMWANNETGIIQPLDEIVRLAHQEGALVHCDGVQAVGKIPVNLADISVDYLSLSGHKFYAPKGIGAAFVRSDVPFTPLIHGGGQEGGRRSSTENTAFIVALGEAARRAHEGLEQGEDCSIGALRDTFESKVQKNIEGVCFHGTEVQRTPNTSHVAFEGCLGTSLLLLLENEGLLASAGSACMAGSQRASHVQRAMGIEEVEARSSLRFSLSKNTTPQEIERAVSILEKAVAKHRSVQGAGVGNVTVYT